MLVVAVLGAGGLLSHYGWALFYPTNADGTFQAAGSPQHLKPPLLQKFLLRIWYGREDQELGAQLHVRGEQKWDEACPFKYNRLGLQDILDKKAQPYILGGKQKPRCSNCKADRSWAHTCQFDGQGSTCTPESQDDFLSLLLSRAKDASSAYAEMLTMTPCDLFPYLRGRTLWLVGDATMREFMQALQCFFLEFWDMDTKSLESLVPVPQPAADGPDRQQLLQQLSTGGWCVQLPQATRICYVQAESGDDLMLRVLPGFPRVTGSSLNDLMLLNFGHAHLGWEDYQANLTNFAHYVRTRQAELPFLIWQESTPQHYDSPNGDYLEPPASHECRPIAGIQQDEANGLQTSLEWMRVVTTGGWRNSLAYSLMDELHVPVVYSWNETLPLWQYHQAYRSELRAGDCTLSCHPSSYQWMVYKFWKTLSWPWCREQIFKDEPGPEPTP
ncbi:hypothetical protein WJX74_003987 [Apatococcus lobatus]|uniref:Uncharacterized protein n=1 Tax=Apatococcus lobatus TaxID=904363 RepID=A0AAW1S534_9CHLO